MGETSLSKNLYSNIEVKFLARFWTAKGDSQQEANKTNTSSISHATYNNALSSEHPSSMERKCERMLTSDWVTKANDCLSARMP